MGNSLLKIILFFGIFLIAGAINLSTVSASGTGPDDQSLAEINEELEVLVDQINDELESGKKSSVVSVKTDDGGTLTLGVAPVKPMESATRDVYSPMATTKNYSAFIGYDGIGLNFNHRVYGTYQYSGGKVGKVSHEVHQTGWGYTKTHNTYIASSDSSVKRVVSRGYFSGISIPFKQYVASLTITVYGSGNYKVTTARID